MASTAAVAQSHNATAMLGDLLETGGAKGSGAFNAAIVTNGIKIVNAAEFAMSQVYSLDAASQNVISETASLTAGANQFYARTQEFNTVQIQKLPFSESAFRAAANNTLDTTNIDQGGFAPILSEFDLAKANAKKQLNIDWEFSAIQGTLVRRNVVGTVNAMGGLLDATIGISTNVELGGGAALSITMINNLLTTMFGNGAEFDRLAFVVRPVYAPILSALYGVAPSDRFEGGVGLKTFVTDFGNIDLIVTNSAPANTVLVADMAYIKPVVLPHEDGSIIYEKEFSDGGSARNGYVEVYTSIDFGSESYHGVISNVA